MYKPHCRYSDDMLKDLGYLHTWQDDHTFHHPVDGSYEEIERLVKGQFKNIIDILFDQKDGSKPNGLEIQVSENASDSVKSFVRNILMCDVKAFQSAPDDETALACLIPRSAQSLPEISPYVDNMVNIIGESRRLREQIVSNSSDS